MLPYAYAANLISNVFFRYEDSTVHLQYTRICVTEDKSLLIAIFLLKLVM